MIALDGVFAQTFSALQTLMRFRDTGQAAHGNLEAELLAEAYKKNVVKASDLGSDRSSTKRCTGQVLPTTQVMFDWPEEEATPLSWHLTQDERAKDRLVPIAKFGQAHVIGLGSACTIHILTV